MTTYPQTYVKGDKTVVAETAADEVRFEFDGFSPVSQTAPSNSDYRELQQRAKDQGINAAQSAAALLAALGEAEPDES